MIQEKEQKKDHQPTFCLSTSGQRGGSPAGGEQPAGAYYPVPPPRFHNHVIDSDASPSFRRSRWISGKIC